MLAYNNSVLVAYCLFSAVCALQFTTLRVKIK